MNSVDISIIVPIYNAEQYLPQCLDSLVNQTHKNIEIICVNDGSTDNSAKIVRAYCDMDSRVRLIEKPNGGQSSARNIGVRDAIGTYLMFVDADDWVDPETCKEIFSVAKKHNVDAVRFDFVKEFENKTEVVRSFEECFFALTVQDVYNNVFLRTVGLTGKQMRNPHKIDVLSTVCTQIYRRSICQHIEFKDISEIGAEDTLYQICFLSQCSSYAYIQRPLYHYRRNSDNSTTNSYRKDLLHQWQRLFFSIDEIIAEYDDQKLLREAFNNRIACSFIGLGLNEVRRENGRLRKIYEALHSEPYVTAFRQLSLSAMPIYWKVFFACCKARCTLITYFILLVMQKMR